MGFEEYNPASTLVVPENKIQKAKFPFVDIHSHLFGMGSQDLAELIAPMDRMNMAVMVNLSGGSGSGLQQMLDNISENYPNRFIVFTNVDFDGVDGKGWTENAVTQLETNIQAGAKGLKIYKKLIIRHKDINGKRLAIDDERLDPIWAKCGELGIPVLIHAADPKPFWDAMDQTNERWLGLKTRPRRKRSDTMAANN